MKKLSSKSFKASLPGGEQVRLTVVQTIEKIQRKAKVVAGFREVGGVNVPILRNIRDKHGEPVLVEVEVQGCRVKVRFDDGHTLEARACCKPPDRYSLKTGVRKALRRLFKADSGIDLASGKKVGNAKRRLNGEARKALYWAVTRVNRKKKCHGATSE